MIPGQSIQTFFKICSDTGLQICRSFGANSNVDELKKEWAEKILSRIGLNLTIKGTPTLGKSVLFVGNHLSYLDIPVLMSAVPGLSFVAKKEIRNWPLFGYGASLIDTVFVDRGNQSDRSKVRQTIGRELEFGKRIALFPSGTTCLNELTEWRRGAFEIARVHAAFIQPFRIRYEPARLAAYIDNDFFPIHLVNLIENSPIRGTIEFHPVVEVQNSEESRQTWQTWARAGREKS